jgi:glucose-6-phosphate 1-epimerase
MDKNSKIRTLNSQFSLTGIAEIVEGNGGLPKIRIETPSARAEIYLHGAQITSWQPTGMGEVLFLSEKSLWQDGKAIRGGIPVCFPWFRAKSDDPHAPSHGFVRTREWLLESISPASEDAVCARFSIGSDDSTRKWWPFEFRLELAITVGRTLRLELKMENTADKTLKFEEALHTYFKVGDVRRARVYGLDGVNYLDNRDGNREKQQQGELALTRQTDNAYRNASGPLEIGDPVLVRRLRTRKKNSNSTIVWNPWSDGAAGMADFGPEEWRGMLCVEGGNIMNSAVPLAAGETHTMSVVIDALAGLGD